MKREREGGDDDDDDDQIRPPTGPYRSTFRINQDITTLSTNSIQEAVNTTLSSLTTSPNNNNANVSKAPSANANVTVGPSNGNNNNNSKEQDRFLPIANVGRIMKKVSPGNGKISKDAKETVQECVSEFISFVTGEASDKCQREKRKTINGDDILWAIMTLGFEDYVTPLKIYLTKYREIEGEKLNVPKQQQRIEQHMQHDQNTNVAYNSVYSTTNLLSQPSFVPTDPPFPLHFSQNSIQVAAGLPQQTATLPQQDQINEHW